METINKQFGFTISKLIRKENLSQDETIAAFKLMFENKTTPMQQGAFLAALKAKGETQAEIAGSYNVIYNFDTYKAHSLHDLELVENCGTGLDSFKTFNISTAGSIIAAAQGVKMARHGSRALTSTCGTVDMAEKLGVDVESSPDLVEKSIINADIGLFNGMSPAVHPQALGRILSQISFGSTLHISASLANPALPTIGVRGVYHKNLILPVLKAMQIIGYKKALVVNGCIEGSGLSFDEASVCGTTWCAELQSDGQVKEYLIKPPEVGLGVHPPELLNPCKDPAKIAPDFINTIIGNGDKARIEAVALNAALIFYISGVSVSIKEGVILALDTIYSNKALRTLTAWVRHQNREPHKGLEKLDNLLKNLHI